MTNEGETAIIDLLTEIRDLLKMPMQTASEDETTCPHPEEMRINLHAMGDGGTEHFKCRQCRQIVRR